MSYDEWLANTWLIRTTPNVMVIASLLSVVDRDLHDAACDQIHPDNRYTIAYNAGRSLCKLALAAEGYSVPKGDSQHQRQIDSLELTLGAGYKQILSQLHKTKKVRHSVEYDAADLVEERDVINLVAKLQQLRSQVVEWLKQRHADLVPPKLK